GLLEEFITESEMLPSWGFCFRASNGKELRYDFRNDGFPYAPFFTSRRLDLDGFLTNRLDHGCCTFMTSTEVTSMTEHAEGIEVFFKKGEEKGSLHTKLLIGAEGEKPV